MQLKWQKKSLKIWWNEKVAVTLSSLSGFKARGEKEDIERLTIEDEVVQEVLSLEKTEDLCQDSTKHNNEGSTGRGNSQPQAVGKEGLAKAKEKRKNKIPTTKSLILAQDER